MTITLDSALHHWNESKNSRYLDCRVQATNMSAQAVFPQPTIADLFGQAWNSGWLTLTARQALRAALLDCSLTEDDQAAIDRLLHAVRRGWLKILD
ncbi:hypothetical protein [Microcoleus sp. FACHB-672]|uniref:hypothetical protein n=1 Tax=Microcoleus sp. FACHB-672 TaxID=2692825 RepID=UPI002815CC7C|nr:hypothetical protein [Microcoleus sp. FACHB-672]